MYENGNKIAPTIQNDIFDTLNIIKQLLIAEFALVGTLCAMETTNAWPLPLRDERQHRDFFPGCT